MKKFLRIGEKISKVSICGNDITKYSILMDGNLANLRATPCEAKPNVMKAATALQSYIFKITDVLIPILYHNFPLRTDYEIRIGDTNRKDFDGIEFGDDDYAIKTVNGDIAINGGKRGILYGVYTFLERYFGVRYFTKDCERILYKEQVDIGEINVLHRMAFEYREYCCWTGWDPDFSVKSKINGNFSRNLRPEDGGMIGFAGGFNGLAHTFEWLVPKEHYKKHPEYFALNDLGERDPSGLCLQNEEVFSVALQTAKKWLAEEEDPRLISVSINDGNVAYCRCEKCRRYLEQGGNEMDNVMSFVNKMQIALREEYPNVSVDTLSYAQVNVLPKIVKPEKGVLVRVCGFGVRNVPFSESIERFEAGEKELEYNASYAKLVQEWGRVADKIYVWDYPYCYNVINTPYPVTHTLLKNTRFFAENNAKGMYINGQTECADFTELKFYLQAKAMADPYMDEEEYQQHYDDFLEGYYGAGWKHIKDFIELSEKVCHYISAMKEPLENFPLKRKEDGSYDEEFIQRGNELFRRAYEMAETDGERRRVRKSWLQLDYYELYSLMDYKMERATKEEKAELIEKNRKMYDELRGLGITRVGERVFMPVVKNFAQSPVEHIYWDFQAVTGDRNNETYARELYVLIPFNHLEVGDKIDFECLYRTNNENDAGYLGVYANGEIINSKQNPTWQSSKKYEKITFSGAEITTAEEFSNKSGLPLNGLMLKFLPTHLKGVVFRVNNMDPGAYMFVRSPKIIMKERL